MTNGEQHRPHEEPEPSFQDRLVDVVRDLERRMKEIEEDDHAELLGLQDQVTKLSERIDAASNRAVAAQDHAAWLDVSSLETALLNAIDLLPLYDARKAPAHDWVLRLSESTFQQIRTSDDPRAVAENFRRRLFEYCRQNNITFFMDVL